MAKNKVHSPRDPLPPHFKSLDEAVEFWETHSLADYEEYWKDVECEFDIQGRTYQVSVESGLYQKLRRRAREKGVSAETLINLWLQEKTA